MAISIRNKKAEQLSRQAAEKFNLSMTDAIIMALEEKLERAGHQREDELLNRNEILGISARCSALPDLDTRTEDEILGYNQIGDFN